MTNFTPCNSQAVAAASAFGFTGSVRTFAGLFCYRYYYYYYGKTKFNRLIRLLLA